MTLDINDDGHRGRMRTKTLDVDNNDNQEQGRIRTRMRDNNEGERQGRTRTQQSKRGHRQQGMMRTRKMTSEEDKGGRGHNNQKEDGSNYEVG